MRIIVFSNNGQQVVDTAPENEGPDTINFAALFTLIQQSSDVSGSGSLSLNIQNDQIDAIITQNYILASVIPMNSPKIKRDLNPIIAQIVSISFDRGGNNPSDMSFCVDDGVYTVLSSMLTQVLEECSLDYISLVSQSGRVFYSIGEITCSLGEFTSSWCSALGCISKLGDEKYISVERHSSVKIFSFLPNAVVVVYFKGIPTESNCNSLSQKFESLIPAAIAGAQKPPAKPQAPKGPNTSYRRRRAQDI